MRLFRRLLGARTKPKTKPIYQKMKSTHFKENVDSRNYSFDVQPNWTYFDGVRSEKPHWVLRDSVGKPRFTLSFDLDPGAITVYSIQRERPKGEKAMGDVYQPIEIIKKGVKNWWVLRRETQKSKQFQQQLNGMHPTEFLFSEFLHQNREEIKSGRRKVFLQPGEKKLYGPIIDRFFKPKPIPTVHYPMYELNLEKKRVKQILELD